MGKVTAILADWRRLFNQLNDDGAGATVGPELLKSMQTVIKASNECCELSFVLHTTLKVLPGIKNLLQRKAAAAKFLKESKNRELGKSISAALTSLAVDGVMKDEEPEEPK